jgi:hypothetical protein
MNRSVLSFVLVTLLIGAAGRADAGIIISIQQVGNDVVAMGSGSIDVTGLSLAFSGNLTARVVPGGAEIIEGPPDGVNNFTAYGAGTGPSSFGSGSSIISASTGSGNIFGVQGKDTGAGSLIFLPSGYTSFTPLSATDTYANKNFTSLGLTPGTYTWTWGDPTPPDPTRTLTVQIGPTPEPASLAIWSLGALGCAVAGYRRRKTPA